MRTAKPSKWGGARKGAGRKKKVQNPETKPVIETPLPGGGFFETETSDRTAPYPGGENHHMTKAYNDLRQAVNALWKMGKVLVAPPDLDEDAKSEWDRLMACYAAQDTDILSTLDITMLRLFCESKSRYMKAYKTWSELLKGKIVVENEQIQRYINNCIKVMNKETDVMKSLAPDLGLTISGRAKMGILAAKAQMNKDEDAQAELSNFFSKL